MIKVIVKDGGIYKFTRVKTISLFIKRLNELVISDQPIQIENIKSVHMGDTEKLKWPHVHNYFNKENNKHE
jgi:hypothetical protein